MSEDRPATPPSAEPPPGVARPARPRWLQVLVLVAVVVLIAGSAVVMVAVLGLTIGIEAVLVGMAAAIVPVPVLLLAFLWLGRYEPEPATYLIVCFAWGASVAVLLAFGVNTGAGLLFGVVGIPEELVAVLVAPVVEEFGKTAVVVLLLFWNRHAITGVTKGIVYCGVSAIGFAMVENILYIGGYGYRAGLDEFGPATGLQQALGVFIVRILMSGFAHPLFTAAAGIGIGIAARNRSAAVKVLAILFGMVAAMILHALWNLMAVLSGWTGQPLVFLYGYVGLMVPLFLGAVGYAIWLRSREGGFLTQRFLPEYVRAGWLSPPEVAALRSLGTRHSARRWARRVAGEPGAKAMRRFQFAATRLALLRDGVHRTPPVTADEAARVATDEQALLAEIGHYRAAFVGRDPQVPPARWDGQGYEVTFPDGVRRPVPAPPEPVVPVPVLLPAPPPAPPGGAGAAQW